MKKIKVIFLISVFAMLLCGCGKNGAKEIKKTISGGGIAKINITLSDDDLFDLNYSHTSSKLYSADMVVSGSGFDGISIRMGDNYYTPDDAEKLNYTVDAAAYTDNRHAQFDLKNCSLDPTYMREVISSRALIDSGVASPYSYYARLYLNGEDNGFYVISEGVDDCFLENNFDDYEGGNLYKAGDGCDLSIEKNDDYGNYGIVYGDDTNADNIKLLAEKIDALGGESSKEIKKFLDTETVLKYIAFNYVFSNYDSLSGSGGTNYYIYENDGYYTLIPGSLQLSLGGLDKGLKVSIDNPVLGQGEYPLIKKLLAYDDLREEYYGYAEWYRNWLDGNFENTVSELNGKISMYVKNDVNAFYPAEVYEKAITYVDVENEAAKGSGLPEPETLAEQTTEAVSENDTENRVGDKISSGQAIGMRVISEADRNPSMGERSAEASTVSPTALATQPVNIEFLGSIKSEAPVQLTAAEKSDKKSETKNTLNSAKLMYDPDKVYDNSFSIINFVREKIEITDKALAAVGYEG